MPGATRRADVPLTIQSFQLAERSKLLQSDSIQNSERLPDMAVQAIYKLLAEDPHDKVTRAGIEAILKESGLRLDDRRLASLCAFLDKQPLQEPISFEEIASAIAGVNTTLLSRALRGELVVPDFIPFSQRP
jgi:hypothetical protein